MPAGLTQRQHDALRFIERYIAEHDGVSPNYPEIAAALKLKSRSGVGRILQVLAERGHIVIPRRSTGVARALSLPTVYGPSCPHCGEPVGSAQCREIAEYEIAERKRVRAARTGEKARATA